MSKRVVIRIRGINLIDLDLNLTGQKKVNPIPSYVSLLKMPAVGSFIRRMCEIHPKDRICRKKPPHKTPSFSWLQFSHLSAAGVFAFQLLIGVSVNVRVLATEVSISSPADSTLGRRMKPPRIE